MITPANADVGRGITVRSVWFSIKGTPHFTQPMCFCNLPFYEEGTSVFPI